MEKYLDRIPNVILESFPAEWFEAYNFGEDVILEENYETFRTVIKKSKEDIFNLLNSSVLTGEYIRVNTFQEDLRNVKESLQNIPQPLPENPELQERLQGLLNINYLECLKVAINMYLDFTVWIKVKVKLTGAEYIDQSNDELADSIESTYFDSDSFKDLLFFQANILISRKDYDLTPVVGDYQYLYSFSRDLLKPERLGGNKFSLLLREKVNFLLTKWILRKKDINGFPVHHIKDSVAQELTTANLSSSHFKSWDDVIQSHYEFAHNWKEVVTADFNELKSKNLEVLTNLELHRLIKYFKDVNKSVSRLKAIRKEIYKRYETAKAESNDYNIFVYSILVNYAINNELSLIEEGENYDALINIYSDIEELQTLTGIYNFFPQHRTVFYLLKQLKKNFNEKIVLSNLPQVRNLINKCKEIVYKYRQNVRWSEKNYNYICYLPFQECNVELGTSELKTIFIASSFVLPLDKTEYIDAFDRFEKDLHNIESSLNMMENVEIELKNMREVKLEVVDVKNSLQAAETKSMETIGIFTTIVTFVLASVSNFKFIASAYQAALFTLCLALSLGLFVFLLLIIREGDIAKKMRKYFLGVLLSTCLLIFLWIILIFAKEIKQFIKPANKSNRNSRAHTAVRQPKSVELPKTITTEKSKPITP